MIYEDFRSLATNLIDADLKDNQLKQLYIVEESLLDNNKKFNLTSLTEPSDILSKHFADSIELGKFISSLNIKQKNLLDIGSGGGFPALPNAIYLTDYSVTALDATAKKMNYIDAVAKAANISNIKTITGRAETISQDPLFREKYPIVTARAVSRLNILLELCSPFTSTNGYVIAMKGAKAKEELDESNNAIKQLNLHFVDMFEYLLPTLDDKRYLLVFKKTSPLDKKYPRQYSSIIKKPL